jgi:hypothetical protein
MTRTRGCRHGQGASISGPNELRGRRWLALADRRRARASVRVGAARVDMAFRRVLSRPDGSRPGTAMWRVGGHTANQQPGHQALWLRLWLATGRAPTPNEELDALLILVRVIGHRFRGAPRLRTYTEQDL